MSNINLKNMLPGIVSIAIIAGMAIQAFATNADMSAFVKRDKYLTTYHELDWYIDDIEKSLDRLYKYSCTNVKTWGGTGWNTHTLMDVWFSGYSGANSYHWYQNPIADFSEEGYLRVAQRDAINAFGNHSKTDVLTKDVPASLLKWRSGVELYPHTKITHKITRVWPNTTSAEQHPTYTFEVEMGPFKKFPHVTGGTSWNQSTICAGPSSLLPGFYGTVGTNAMYYAHGTDTRPTSWTTLTSAVFNNTTSSRNNTSTTTEFRDQYSATDLEENSYDNPDKANSTLRYYYYSTLPGVNISSYDKVWIRIYCSATNITYSTAYDTGSYNLTTWNNNK